MEVRDSSHSLDLSPRKDLLGSIELDETSSVGETGYILQYAMTLVQPQPVTLLQVGGKQTGLSSYPIPHLGNR